MTRAVDIEGRGVRVEGRGIGVGSDIPDNVVVQLDPTVSNSLQNGGSQATDGGSIDEWLDQTSISNDVTGGQPTRVDNVQNGNTVVRFDGVVDYLNRIASDYPTLTQPVTIISVITDANFTGGFQRVVYRGDTSTDTFGTYRYDGNWAMFAGDSVIGGTTSPPLILSAVFDGSDSEIRENGTQTGTGNCGSDSMGSIELGARDGGDIDFFDADFGSQLVYDGDLRATGDLSREENRLANKWGIVIA